MSTYNCKVAPYVGLSNNGFKSCRAPPLISSAVTQLLAYNAVPLSAIGAANPTPPIHPLIFSGSGNVSSPYLASTAEQLLFTVPCVSTVTLYFSGTFGFNDATASTSESHFYISLVNALAPAVELSRDAAYAPTQFSSGLALTDGTVPPNTYVTPQPVSLTATFTLVPGTYSATARVALVTSTSLSTNNFNAYLGGNMTARIVKGNL